MNPATDKSTSPRRLLDEPVEAFAAIVLRYLGGGYVAPRQPKIAEGWVADFQETFSNHTILPIQTVFRANPFKKGGKKFDAIPEGEASWPVFAIWRSRNAWKQFTVGSDANTVNINFAWALPGSANVERNWALLTHFDHHFRRVLKGIYRDEETKALLNAALVRDYMLPWQSYQTDQDFDGPAQRAIYPTLTGTFQFSTYWGRTEENLGLIHPAFNRAYFEYLLRHRKESGSMEDTRLNPSLISGADPIPPDQGATWPPPP